MKNEYRLWILKDLIKFSGKPNFKALRSTLAHFTQFLNCNYILLKNTSSSNKMHSLHRIKVFLRTSSAPKHVTSQIHLRNMFEFKCGSVQIYTVEKLNCYTMYSNLGAA